MLLGWSFPTCFKAYWGTNMAATTRQSSIKKMRTPPLERGTFNGSRNKKDVIV
jgi:hypothetical protein